MTDQWGSNIEIKGIDLTGVLKLNRDTRENIAHTIDDQGRENVKLRKRVADLKASLNPYPLFSQTCLSCSQLILCPII